MAGRSDARDTARFTLTANSSTPARIAPGASAASQCPRRTGGVPLSNVASAATNTRLNNICTTQGISASGCPIAMVASLQIAVVPMADSASTWATRGRPSTRAT
jgi:hypothetical protein